MSYFDYEAIVLQAGIPADKLARLAKSFAEEEPNDPMLAELHATRACVAISGKGLTIEGALADAQTWQPEESPSRPHPGLFLCGDGELFIRMRCGKPSLSLPSF